LTDKAKMEDVTMQVSYWILVIGKLSAFASEGKHTLAPVSDLHNV